MRDFVKELTPYAPPAYRLARDPQAYVGIPEGLRATWPDLDESVRPHWLRMVADLQKLDPALDVSLLVAPSADLSIPLMTVLHYPMFACKVENWYYEYMKNPSNRRINQLLQEQGTLDDTFIVDVVPIRTHRKNPQDRRPYLKQFKPVVLNRIRQCVMLVFEKTRARIIQTH